MKRPTIPDLAKHAGVSVSTVNRVIGGSTNVRQITRERIFDAATEIGFYGLKSIELEVEKGRESHKLGILLQQSSRTFSQILSDVMHEAADKHQVGAVDLTVEFLDDLTADTVAARLIDLGERCESVALLAAGHPILSDAIDYLLAKGIPVTALVSQLSAKGSVSYVGLDGWKVGRTAAWAFDKIVRKPGKVGILVGNHRYRCQELNESGFRSYFREYNPNFTLLEPLLTYEAAAVARELTENLLKEHPDLCGLFVSGGGISGVLAALRNLPQPENFFVVGYELFDATRAALIDGTLDFLISHPFEEFAHAALDTMIKAKRNRNDLGARNVIVDFDIYTSENV